MSTYGTRDATQFRLPSVESDETYYTLIDSDTNKITLKRISNLSWTESLDATVGTIEVSGPNAGKLIPGAGATPTEKKAFAQQPQAIKTVKDKATETVTKAKIKNGVDPKTAQTEANKAINPNSASDTANAEESQRALSEELEKSKTLSRFNFPQDLKYPADLQIAQQDVIQFNMLRYVPKKLDKQSNEGLGGFEKRQTWDQRIIGKVFLPIPGGISDTNSVTWGSDTMTSLESGLAAMVDEIISSGVEAGAGVAGNRIEAVGNNSGDVKTGVKAYFTSTAIGKSNILARTEGAIQNPNMELLFSGPTLRPFTFNFKLSARGTKDRDQIRQIIRFFKQGMAVQRTQSQLFLKAPHTFKIRYLHKKDQDHPYINLIKECALQSFTVNYTPEGNYMTFADGLMTSYEITMQFQELEPIFNDDYGNLDGKSIDTNIGY